jgi:hypothetical protein
MQPHPESFFTRFPYDIRVVIYSYLEPTALPPFAPSFSNPGFYLSCHQAKQELDEIVHDCLCKYLAHIKTTMNTDFNPTIDPNKPHNITVTVPFAGLHNIASNSPYKAQLPWTNEVLSKLHPLFAEYFYTVRIHIGTGSATDTVPEHTTLSERGRIEVSMHRLLRDVAYMINRVNYVRPESDTAGGGNVPLGTMFPHTQGEEEKSSPPRHIKTRRICLSWDLRDKADAQDVVLNGKLYQSCNLGRESYSAEALARRAKQTEPDLSNEVGQQDGNPAWRPRTVFYHVRDDQRLAGQMCLQSNRRWAPCEEGHFVNETLNALECTEEYVSCKGLGVDVEQGLRQVDEDMFELREREVEAALWPVYDGVRNSGV